MEETFVPFRGIKNDLKGRLLCYKQDWTGGLRAGIRFVNILFLIFYITDKILKFSQSKWSDKHHSLGTALFSIQAYSISYWHLFYLTEVIITIIFFRSGSWPQQHTYSLLQQFQLYLLESSWNEIQVEQFLFIFLSFIVRVLIKFLFW